jgi:hypothetical protein
MATRNEDRDLEPGYEPPKVETVLTEEELAREVQYAGTQSVDSLL